MTSLAGWTAGGETNSLRQPQGLDHGGDTRSRTGAGRAGPGLPYPEGPPLLSLLVAGVISFILLSVSPRIVGPLLTRLPPAPEAAEVGALSLQLPIFTSSVLLESLLGSLVLMVTSLA